MNRETCKRLIRSLANIEDALLVAMLTVMIVLAVGQVLMRNFFGLGFPWGDPIIRLLVLWIGLMGVENPNKCEHL